MEVSSSFVVSSVSCQPLRSISTVDSSIGFEMRSLIIFFTFQHVRKDWGHHGDVLSVGDIRRDVQRQHMPGHHSDHRQGKSCTVQETSWPGSPGAAAL